MAEEKNVKENKAEVSMEDLEQVTGGTMREQIRTKQTTDISEETIAQLNKNQQECVCNDDSLVIIMGFTVICMKFMELPYVREIYSNHMFWENKCIDYYGSSHAQNLLIGLKAFRTVWHVA